MNDTQLHTRFGKHCFNGISKTGQAKPAFRGKLPPETWRVDAGDEDIFNAPVLQFS